MEDGINISAFMNMGNDGVQLIVGLFVLIPFVYLMAFYVVHMMEISGFLPIPEFRRNEKKGYINCLRSIFSFETPDHLKENISDKKMQPAFSIQKIG